ncbi:MAG: hypothetical protein CVV21_04320 [Candidatus Goldiibacteriota bacterium HGW-Goldbacteria-1]|jgi:peptidoglycan glycosyltransferase|nr:MAG: hypothetical protein CVV21_04320 [Candidatus Goldiibacteriota bacterium HGW-Goldbacteria-1]
MLNRKAISHLSSGSYYKRKRLGFIFWAILAFIVLAGAFHFFGKNLQYALNVKSGAANLKKGKLAAATSNFNKAVNIKRDGALAIDGLGAVALKQGDFQKAEKLYTEAMAAGLKPNKTINHSVIGNEFMDGGLYRYAETEFKHAVALNQFDAEAMFGLGSCAHAATNLDEAIKYYNKALQYNPKLSKARKNLSLAEDDRNKGAIYYMYDRNGEPLARYNLIPGQGKKTYILDQRAAHITGFDSEKRQTKEGIEKHLAEYIPGNRIYLTIDSKIQNTISRALGWYKGAVVVLNPKTGEILGLYSQPTFKPNTIDQDWWDVVGNRNKPLLNRATDKLYEPGSIAKMITIASAYEYAIDPQKIFPVKCPGHTYYDNKIFWCWTKHGKVKSIEQTVDTSCNIGAAELAFAIGSPRLTEYNTKFGFGQQLDLGFMDITRNVRISIPVKTSSAPMNDRTKFDLAMHACGLSYEGHNYTITPLHAALLAATIANDGVMMDPYMIKEIRNINGKIIYQAAPRAIKKPVTPETADKITRLMIDSVENGIGQKARVNGISIAGKTGTSGKSGALNAWFISFAPAENPEYAIAICGDSEGKGMSVAAPVAGDIYKDLFK